MKAVGKLSVIEMIEGVKYPVSDLGRCRLSICPVCGKVIATHKEVRCVNAPDKGAQGCKSIVGVGCTPTVDAASVDGLNVIEFRVNLKNGDASLANLLYATRNQPREYTAFRDSKGHFIKNAGTLRVYVDKCNAIAKLASAIARYASVKAQRINNGEWTAVDSATWTEEMGCGIYKGFKVYGI